MTSHFAQFKYFSKKMKIMDLFLSTLVALSHRELRAFTARGLRRRFRVWSVTPVEEDRRREKERSRRKRNWL